MRRQKQFRMACIICLLMTGSFASAQERGSRLDLVKQPGSWNGRLTLLGSEAFYTKRALVVKRVNDRDVIGLTHSGYTGRDPDGRNAILNLTVTADSMELTEADRREIERLEWKLRGEVAVVEPVRCSIDLELLADREEEARLRKAMALPKVIDALSDVPLQFRWKNVRGKTLHNWLTSEAGLRVVFRTVGRIQYPLNRRVLIPKEWLGKWWDARVGVDKELVWTGGGSGLVKFLADENGIVVEGRSGTARLDDVGEEAMVLASRIEQAAPDDGRARRVARDNFLAIDWMVESSKSMPVTFPMVLGTQPGSLLQAKPEHVKDLTGNHRGLDALLKDSD